MLTLVIGYAGYYVCRSNLSVATPLLLDAFGADGLDKTAIGWIATVGTLTYAIGKLFNGVLTDFLGGRRMFLGGMIGSVIATVVFGFGTGLAVFVTVWGINRLVQSMGWSALVKVTSNWFSHRQYGVVMGILSLSFLFGDVLARLYLGQLVGFGWGWQGVFFGAAAVLGVIALVSVFVLKERPADVGLAPVAVNPNNVYGAEGERERPESLATLIGPYLKNSSFWLVMVLSLGLTIIREAFNFWTPTYLSEVAGLSDGAAGQYSALFPLFGGVSVLLAGWISDRLSDGKRGIIIVAAMLPLVGVLLAMGRIDQASAWLPLALVSLAALLMIGPYSFLAGAISLDLGGKQGGATAAGFVDSIGYFGSSVLSGVLIGAIAEQSGWSAVFYVLAAVAMVTLVAALLYWRVQERA
ncbi:MAG: MFS transporter [Rhodothermales bacterium]